MMKKTLLYFLQQLRPPLRITTGIDSIVEKC
jgi:hypothetical protein